MTDTEKSQLRQDLMAQFEQMMAQPTSGSQDYVGEGQPTEWSPQG